MKISLMLDNVTQDQLSAGPDDIAFHGWMHGPSSGGSKVGEGLPKYSVRKEEWGGILVFGPTQSVYQLDAEAFGAILRLKSGETMSAIHAAPAPLTSAAATQFEELIRSLSLN